MPYAALWKMLAQIVKGSVIVVRHAKAGLCVNICEMLTFAVLTDFHTKHLPSRVKSAWFVRCI